MPSHHTDRRSRIWASFALFVALAAVFASSAAASHFRFGHITWIQDANDAMTANVTFLAGFRRSGYNCVNPSTGANVTCSAPDGQPGLGDVFHETIGATRIDDFGDGDSTPTLFFKVFAFDVEQDWVVGRALNPANPSQEFIPHTYTGTGPFTLYSASCCRASALRAPNAHINNPDRSYRVESIVHLKSGGGDEPVTGTSASPFSLLPPLVNCVAGQLCRFTVAAIDPDAHDPDRPCGLNNAGCPVRVRLAEPEEMGGATLVQPDGARVFPLSSVYLFDWNTRGVELGPDGFNTLYSAQVVIEDLDDDGNPISKSALDFFIRLVEPSTTTAEATISVPVRWCALDGSPAVEDPSLAGEEFTTTDGVLVERLARATDNVYLPEATMQMISGARDGEFPAIEGPFTPSGGTNMGHIPSPRTQGSRDLRRAWNLCRLTWRDKDPAVTGLVVLNVNRFTTSSGTPVTDTLGWASVPDEDDLGKQILSGVSSVTDTAYFVDEVDDSLPTPHPLAPDALEKWLSHEVGHSLSLCHNTGTSNLMNDTLSRAISLTDTQTRIIRKQADRYIPDRIVEEPEELRLAEALALAPPVGATWPDELEDVPAGADHVDLDTVGLGVDEDRATTHLFALTLGLIPDGAQGLAYTFAADLDGDLATGGLLSDLGYADSAQGLELVGRVEVDASVAPPQASAAVWRYESGAFTPVSDPTIQPQLATFDIVSPDPEGDVEPSGQIVQLLIANGARGSMGPEPRLVVLADDGESGAFDRVEGPIVLTPPPLPSCALGPALTLAGGLVAVTADLLPAGGAVEVFLGSTRLASTAADGSGQVSVDVTIPADASTGSRSVTVRSVDTAAAAFCHLRLVAGPDFDVPPTPDEGSVLTANVGEELTFTVQASDRDAGDEVTLSAVGVPAGASFSPGPPANPASGVFSWVPSEDQVGSYAILFTATDSSGLSAPPWVLSIDVRQGDVTPPALTVTVEPAELWPPNHKLRLVDVGVDAVDDVDPAPVVRLVSVTSNEPDDAPGGGDGATTGDVVIEDDFTIRLRAERDGRGDGRVYTLTYEAVDAAGNAATASAVVTVPHDQG